MTDAARSVHFHSNMASVRRIENAARASPEKAKDAAMRLAARVEQAIRRAHEEKRESVAGKRGALERAFEAVVHATGLRPGASLAEANYYSGFVRIQETRGEPLQGSALEVHVADVTPRLHASWVEAGIKASLAEAEAEVRGEFDARGAQNQCAGAYYMLSMELRRLIGRDVLDVRSTKEWWELAVLFLLVESPGTNVAALGFPPEVEGGGWSTGAHEMFEQRSEMKRYLGGIGWKEDREWLLLYNAMLDQTASAVGVDPLIGAQVAGGVAGSPASDGREVPSRPSQAQLDSLRPAVCNAMSLYWTGCEAEERYLSDGEAHEWLVKRQMAERIPNVSTFSRYLSLGRKMLGTPKHKPRLQAESRSIVRTEPERHSSR